MFMKNKVTSQYKPYLLCDMIKQNELGLTNTDFKIKLKKADNFWFPTVLQTFNGLFLWNQLTNFTGVCCEGTFADDVYNQLEINLKYLRLILLDCIICCIFFQLNSCTEDLLLHL